MTLKALASHALTLLSGASLTFAFAPFHLWPVVFLGLALAVYQLARSNRNGFFTGWLFGLGWFGAGVSWVHVSIAEFGGMPLVASVALMLLLSSYLALYPALAFYLLKRFFPITLWPLALPLCWVFPEWLRSWVLSGFPWLSIGYSQLDSPLAGWLPILGETGVSAIIVLLAAALAVWQIKRHWVGLVTLYAVVMISGMIANGYVWVTPDKTYDVAMVQGNIQQSLRWTPEQDKPTMEKYRRLTASLWDSDLIIWPEAAVPRVEPLALDYLFEMDELAASKDSALITGIVNSNWESDQAWNSLLVLGKRHANEAKPQYSYFHANRYSKHHLLPIGEFVPLEDFLRPLAPLFNLPMSSFSRGDYQQTNLLANGIRLAPAICFEIAFPRQVAANVHDDTDMIVTVSNDAWFGRSHGPAQHLEIARMRAKEFGRPVLRATNNGITAFVDHRGEITARLPQFEAGSISAPVTATRGNTPYHWFGDILPFTLSGLLFLVAIYLKRKRSQVKPG